MKILPCVLFGLLPFAVFAADSSTPLATQPVPKLTAESARNTPSGLSRSGEFVFSILPKSFQRNPTLEMTVNTEFTDYGRMLRPATPEQPVYFAELDVGYKQLGAAVGGEHPAQKADVEHAMKKALAVNGYLVSENPRTQVPSLVVIYYWGSHNTLDPEMRRMFPDLAAKNRLERAILVGGKKYATSEASVMEFGETILDRQDKQEFLRDQSTHDVYYVVASAYDYALAAKNVKKLAWRTTMTVSSTGVSMGETMVPLIATAGPFFGHETTEPQIDIRKSPRSGKVEVGTPTVVKEKSEKK